MFRSLLRLIGFVLAAAAFAALIVDGTRSIAAKQVLMFTLEETFGWLAPGFTASLRGTAAHGVAIANDVLAYALRLPTGITTLGLALLFFVAGRRRSDGIGLAGSD